MLQPLAKRRIKLAFLDFWEGFDPRANYFRDLLTPHYDVDISDRPDFVIYSTFGRRFLDFACPRICYVGEPRYPNFFECDYALSFDFPHLGHGGRNYRLPHYALYADPAVLVRPPGYDARAVLAKKTGFCNFVYRRSGLPGHVRRERFFEKLSRYKWVDSGGIARNNIGGPVADKRGFIAGYKFTIAFENTSQPGYVTEKLFDPLQAGSVPIYWGHPMVAQDFNPASFVDAGRFRHLDALVDFLVALDRDDERYLEVLGAPPLPGNQVNESIRPPAVLRWFDEVFGHPEPIRGRHRLLGRGLTAARKIHRDARRRWDAVRLRFGDAP